MAYKEINYTINLKKKKKHVLSYNSVKLQLS